MSTNRFGRPLRNTRSSIDHDDDDHNHFVEFLGKMKKRHWLYYVLIIIITYILLGSTPIFDHRNWVLPPSDELKLLCHTEKIQIVSQYLDSNKHFLNTTFNILVTQLVRTSACVKYINNPDITQDNSSIMRFVFHRSVEIPGSNDMNLTYINESILLHQYELFPVDKHFFAWYYGTTHLMHYSYGNLELLSSMKNLNLDEHNLSSVPIESTEEFATIVLLGFGKAVIIFFLILCILMGHFTYYVIKSNW